MTQNRIGIALITIFLIVVITAGQITTTKVTNNQEDDVITYTIGYLPITHALPVFEEKELLELENRGIRIELQKFSSWTDLTDALHAGKIDGASELIELAMGARAKGIDLKAVALGHKDGNVIVVSDDIQSMEDLKGRTLAIPSTQSSHFILLQDELKLAGLGINDITITQLAPSEMPASLASGAIDGYCVAEPFGAQAVTQGFGHVLANSQELWDDSICCAFVFRTDVIEKDPETFARLLDAYHEAGKKLDHDEAKKIAVKYLGQDDTTLDTSLEWIRYDDLVFSKEAYAELCDKVIEDDIMDTPPSYEEFVYQAQ